MGALSSIPPSESTSPTHPTRGLSSLQIITGTNTNHTRALCCPVVGPLASVNTSIIPKVPRSFGFQSGFNTARLLWNSIHNHIWAEIHPKWLTCPAHESHCSQIRLRTCQMQNQSKSKHIGKGCTDEAWRRIKERARRPFRPAECTMTMLLASTVPQRLAQGWRKWRYK